MKKNKLPTENKSFDEIIDSLYNIFVNNLMKQYKEKKEESVKTYYDYKKIGLKPGSLIKLTKTTELIIWDREKFATSFAEANEKIAQDKPSSVDEKVYKVFFGLGKEDFIRDNLGPTAKKEYLLCIYFGLNEETDLYEAQWVCGNKVYYGLIPIDKFELVK